MFNGKKTYLISLASIFGTITAALAGQIFLAGRGADHHDRGVGFNRAQWHCYGNESADEVTYSSLGEMSWPKPLNRSGTMSRVTRYKP